MNDFNFMFLTNNVSNSFFSNADSESGSLLNNTYDNISSLLTATAEDCGMDAFVGKDMFGSADISNLNESFFTSSPQNETMGDVAYNSAETAGSVAYAGGSDPGACVGACASASADAGSCGGGSFSSVC